MEGEGFWYARVRRVIGLWSEFYDLRWSYEDGVWEIGGDWFGLVWYAPYLKAMSVLLVERWFWCFANCECGGITKLVSGVGVWLPCLVVFCSVLFWHALPECDGSISSRTIVLMFNGLRWNYENGVWIWGV